MDFQRELTWVGDLEQHVLHNVAAVLPLELERLAAKRHVVEAPGRSREHGGKTLLALEHLEHEVHSLLASISSSPRLSGHGVGRVPVGSEGLAVDPSLGDSIAGLSLVETHHLCDDGGGGQLDEHNVVETDLVERVLQRHAALDLVGPDHSLEDVSDLEDLAVAEVAAGPVCPGDPVGCCEDGAQVVRGVTPLSGQPAVVEVEPPDHGTDVESTVHRVKLVVGTGHLCTIGHDGSLDDGSKNVPALLELQRLETAAKCVDEDPTGGVEL